MQMIHSNNSSSTSLSTQNSVSSRRRQDAIGKNRSISYFKNQNNFSHILTSLKRRNALDISAKINSDENFKRFHENDKILAMSSMKPNITLSNFVSTSDTRNEFASFENIRELDLSSNALRCVRIPLENCPKIEKLDLSRNFLTSRVFTDLMNLPCLRMLDLSGNGLSFIPSEIHLRKLEELNLADNHFGKASDIANLALLPSLLKLCLANNEFSAFPVLRLNKRAFLSDFKKSYKQDRHDGQYIVDYKIEFDDVLSPNGIKALLRAYIRKRENSIPEKDKNPLTSTSHQITKSLELTSTYSKLVDRNLIFPKLEHLDMSENMISSEEAILSTVVCPNLKTIQLFGNPLVDQYSNAPPKILIILVKTLGISIECERSNTWGFSRTKPNSIRGTPSRKNQLTSLNLRAKSDETNAKGGLKSDSEGSPMSSQLEMRKDYNDLSKDIQQCLDEFRSLEIKLECSNDCEFKNESFETHELGKNHATSIPERTRTALKADTEVLNDSKIKIHNPFLDGISNLRDKNFYHPAIQNKRYTPNTDEDFANRSKINKKVPYENLNLITQKVGRNKHHSFYTSDIKKHVLNVTQKQKESLLYVKLQDLIENGNMSD